MNRILEITDELQLKFENIWVLGNRFPDDLKMVLDEEIHKIKKDNVKLLGFISNNDEISKKNLMDGNLLELSKDNPSYQQAKDIFAKII